MAALADIFTIVWFEVFFVVQEASYWAGAVNVTFHDNTYLFVIRVFWASHCLNSSFYFPFFEGCKN